MPSSPRPFGVSPGWLRGAFDESTSWRQGWRQRNNVRVSEGWRDRPRRIAIIRLRDENHVTALPPCSRRPLNETPCELGTIHTAAPNAPTGPDFHSQRRRARQDLWFTPARTRRPGATRGWRCRAAIGIDRARAGSWRRPVARGPDRRGGTLQRSGRAGCRPAGRNGPKGRRRHRRFIGQGTGDDAG